jgi:hypothetical protein
LVNRRTIKTRVRARPCKLRIARPCKLRAARPCKLRVARPCKLRVARPCKLRALFSPAWRRPGFRGGEAPGSPRGRAQDDQQRRRPARPSLGLAGRKRPPRARRRRAGRQIAAPQSRRSAKRGGTQPAGMLQGTTRGSVRRPSATWPFCRCSRRRAVLPCPHDDCPRALLPSAGTRSPQGPLTRPSTMSAPP